jgi:hypothetical protein
MKKIMVIILCLMSFSLITSTSIADDDYFGDEYKKPKEPADCEIELTECKAECDEDSPELGACIVQCNVELRKCYKDLEK